ncbi:MAG: hypothetical protein II298_00415 [Bacteroidales bacterium]|nr:hypothetical protein [Bacteroidales bacterium]
MRLLKKSLLVLVLLFIGVVSYCQPRPPQNPQVGDISNVGLHRNPQTPGAPIAPATLLLVGMGATAVGVKLYRNSKQQ